MPHRPCDVESCDPVPTRLRFICKNNGVLFENDILQIGIKSEYRLNLGRVGIFFGNKTPIALMVRGRGREAPGLETVEEKTVEERTEDGGSGGCKCQEFNG